MDHILYIPDELIAWGKDPGVAVRFRRPWAHATESLIAQAPLDATGLRRLLARLEGLVSEALRANRADLCLGFDVQTAAWLGLKVSFDAGSRRVVLGRDGDYTWTEMDLLFEAGRPEEALRAAEEAKSLLGQVFPGARISAMMPPEVEREVCVACGEPNTTLLVDTDAGSYCRRCWVGMTSAGPFVPPARRRARR